jgi:peptidoglycan/xylan/chitin deacetylase (PgdA/CDA1 family)
MSRRTTRVLKTVLSALHYSGADSMIAPFTRGIGAIFVLHHVSAEKPGRFEPNRIRKVAPQFLELVIRQVRASGFEIVSLAAAHFRLVEGDYGKPFVCFTFDDGYRDNLENALPVLRRHGYPAVLFVPIGYLDDGRPLPHEESLRALGVRNETLGWDDLAELEAGGVRVESHGIAHRALSELDPSAATREIALSKLRLEEKLGREVEAFAFVKGSPAHYRPEHASLVQQAGYKLAFTSVSGANGPTSDRFRLRRYNVEPYPARTFELVLTGACDLIAVKDTVIGTYGRRALNAAFGTSTR